MINGILNVYKEAGFTSHDVVAKLRGIVKQKKIGHTGTLDPDATGVLPVCLGNATKLCDMLTDKNKTYETVMLLGTVTDTQDTSGTVLVEKEVLVSKEQIQDTILSFIGEYHQVPPMYSALKVNGKKLYELAREGKVVERKARPVKFYDITINWMDLQKNQVSMTVSCSKGTYIRTLCHDIGEKLGCGACMSELKRTKVSNFTIKDSLTLGQIEELTRENKLDQFIITVEDMFPQYDKVFIKEEVSKLIYNGNSFLNKDISSREYSTIDKDSKNGLEDRKVRVYDYQSRFVGIYIEAGEGLYKPEKMFL